MGGNIATCICDAGYHADGTNCIADSGVCADVTCSDHGTCAVVNGDTATCICETGYHDMGTTCVPDCAMAFSDDFSAGTLDSAWTVTAGPAAAVLVTGGELRLVTASGDSNNIRLLVGDSSWSDFTIELDAYMESYDTQGLLAIAIGPPPVTASDFYCDAWVYEGYDLAGIGSCGSGNSWATSTGFSVNTGQWYHLKAVVQGDTTTLFVDGVQQVEYTASVVITGPVGIRAYTDTALFDNFSVTCTP